MALRSLLLCQDTATAELVARAFRELSLEIEHCGEADGALLKLRTQRFDAIVVDDADPAGAALILESARTMASCRNSLGIVLAQTHTTLSTAFSTGTHLVIYKPLSADRLRNSLRALRNLIGRRHQREFPRVDVEIPARLHLEDKNEVPVFISDLGQGGLALSSQTLLPTTGTMEVEFILPDRTSVVTASGEVVWRDAHGRVGLQFNKIEPECRKVLDEWLASHLVSGPYHRTRKLVKTAATPAKPAATSALSKSNRRAPHRFPQ
jgi:ActR/RegA family two-component response regulator